MTFSSTSFSSKVVFLVMILPCDKQRCTCGFIVNKIFGERLDDNISISPDIGVRSGGEFIFELRISENGGEAWVLTVRH